MALRDLRGALLTSKRIQQARRRKAPGALPSAVLLQVACPADRRESRNFLYWHGMRAHEERCSFCGVLRWRHRDARVQESTARRVVIRRRAA